MSATPKIHRFASMAKLVNLLSHGKYAIYQSVEMVDATQQNIPLHPKNLVEDGELDAAAVVKESLTTPCWSGGHAIAGDRWVVHEHTVGPL